MILHSDPNLVPLLGWGLRSLNKEVLEELDWIKKEDVFENYTEKIVFGVKSVHPQGAKTGR